MFGSVYVYLDTYNFLQDSPVPCLPLLRKCSYMRNMSQPLLSFLCWSSSNWKPFNSSWPELFVGDDAGDAWEVLEKGLGAFPTQCCTMIQHLFLTETELQWRRTVHTACRWRRHVAGSYVAMDAIGPIAKCQASFWKLNPGLTTKHGSVNLRSG